ncbi:hypothetical protein E2C01_059150 [Portunus trituberculatus]|uniref:Uncharacterized protein n=1 Tax=Portunus trituberculatus TaxID=210409 RepID=A0A5B7H516_PORTR|nr:hypothetical protein [Portunus trituberculatus]
MEEVVRNCQGFIFTNVLQDYYKNMYAAIHAREKDYEDQELFSELYAELIVIITIQKRNTGLC